MMQGSQRILTKRRVENLGNRRIRQRDSKYADAGTTKQNRRRRTWRENETSHQKVTEERREGGKNVRGKLKWAGKQRQCRMDEMKAVTIGETGMDRGGDESAKRPGCGKKRQ